MNRAGHAAIEPDSCLLADEQVVDRVRAGEVSLFEVLMRRHNERLYRAVRSVLGRDDDAEDVMQQAYLSAYQHLRQFEGRARFATWLTRIALNEAFARIRRDRRLVQPPWEADAAADAMPEPTAATPTPEISAAGAELRGLLESAIDTLPPSYRTVFVLRAVQTLTTTETASCLELSEEAVKTRLHRANAMLRQTLLETVGATSPAAFRFERPRCDRVVAAVLAGLGPARQPDPAPDAFGAPRPDGPIP
jgi:RNA polymerase sigma-70 factor (ECF subfamily)